jgi:hypothetical protein
MKEKRERRGQERKYEGKKKINRDTNQQKTICKEKGGKKEKNPKGTKR